METKHTPGPQEMERHLDEADREWAKAEDLERQAAETISGNFGRVISERKRLRAMAKIHRDNARSAIAKATGAE